MQENRSESREKNARTVSHFLPIDLLNVIFLQRWFKVKGLMLLLLLLLILLRLFSCGSFGLLLLLLLLLLFTVLKMHGY